MNRRSEVSRPPWKPAPVPSCEAIRLEDLRVLGLLDTEPEERFDWVTRVCRQIFEVDVALVTLVDAERQWFKSKCGIDASETGRDVSFCGHAVAADEPLVVQDTRRDDRFAENPLVVGPPHIRFYAGIVLHGPAGLPVGTLCLVDSVQRVFSPDDRRLLREFAIVVEEQLVRDARRARLCQRCADLADADHELGIRRD